MPRGQNGLHTTEIHHHYYGVSPPVQHTWHGSRGSQSRSRGRTVDDHERRRHGRGHVHHRTGGHGDGRRAEKQYRRAHSTGVVNHACGKRWRVPPGGYSTARTMDSDFAEYDARAAEAYYARHTIKIPVPSRQTLSRS